MTEEIEMENGNKLKVGNPNNIRGFSPDTIMCEHEIRLAIEFCPICHRDMLIEQMLWVLKKIDGKGYPVNFPDGSLDYYLCHICDQDLGGHTNDCKLAAAIEKAEAMLA